jgi:hypothetical protein
MSNARAEKLLVLALENPELSDSLIRSALVELRRPSELSNGFESIAGVASGQNPTVIFPLQIRGSVRGQQVVGRLFQSGRVQIEGADSETPSGSASRLLEYSEDGWRFWCYQDPITQEWRPINDLRDQGFFKPPSPRRRR